MTDSLKSFKDRALSNPAVRREYEKLADEFAFIDEILKARAEAGLSQSEIARRIGTTQSAIARLESPASGHSPSITTLQRYASALGYKVQVRLVKDSASGAGGKKTRARVLRTG